MERVPKAEAVVMEKEFKTKEEAEAYVQGFHDTMEAIDSEEDSYGACVDTKPAEDEP